MIGKEEVICDRINRKCGIKFFVWGFGFEKIEFRCLVGRVDYVPVRRFPW